MSSNILIDSLQNFVQGIHYCQKDNGEYFKHLLVFIFSTFDEDYILC
jgi:hypothetical protein